MNQVKTISLFVMCFAMVFGSVANAAIPCCMDMNAAEQPIQMDGDLPCHQANDAEPMLCDGCGCDHCMQMSAMLVQVPSNSGVQREGAPIVFDQSAHTLPLGKLFQPPKSLS